MLELLRKLKSLEDPEKVDEIKGNEKVLFDKNKNVIFIVSYPKTLQFDKVVKHNEADWSYLNEQEIVNYLKEKGIDVDNLPIKEVIDAKEKETIKNNIKEEELIKEAQELANETQATEIIAEENPIEKIEVKQKKKGRKIN